MGGCDVPGLPGHKTESEEGIVDDKGRIIEVSVEEHNRLMREREIEKERAEGRRYISPAPLTDDEAAFFRSKGMAFRELWGKRLARGLTVDQRELLDSLVGNFMNARKE